MALTGKLRVMINRYKLNRFVKKISKKNLMRTDPSIQSVHASTVVLTDVPDYLYVAKRRVAHDIAEHLLNNGYIEFERNSFSPRPDTIRVFGTIKVLHPNPTSRKIK